MKFILGRKLNMTQIWEGDKLISVTKVKAGPCFVVQVKKKDKDGYEAVQIGFGERKEKNIKKPQIGHLKKADIKAVDNKNLKHLREFRVDKSIDIKPGDEIDILTFEKGDKIQVTSTSKGKGFQGVVKRHHFSGGRKSHGNKDQLRMPGSIGPKGPAHVFKGTRMGGRMGGDRVTVKNLEIIGIIEEDNVLLIKGAVAGATSGLVQISGIGELKLKIKNNKADLKEVEAEKRSEVNKEAKNDEKVEDKENEKVEDKENEKVEDKENEKVEDKEEAKNEK